MHETSPAPQSRVMPGPSRSQAFLGWLKRFALALAVVAAIGWLIARQSAEEFPDPARNPRFLRELEGHHHRVTGLAYSPNANRLVTTSWDGEIIIWSPDQGEERRISPSFVERSTRRAGRSFATRPRGTAIQVVACSHNGSELAVGCWDGVIEIWTLANIGVPEVLLGDAGGEPLALAFDGSGGRLLSASSAGGIALWDVNQRKVTLRLAGHPGGALAVAFLQGETHMASAGADGLVRVWSLADGRAVTSFSGHQGRVNALAVHPGGKIIATGGDDQTIRLVDVVTEQSLGVFHARAPVTTLAFEPMGARLVSGGRDGWFQVWEMFTGELRESQQAHAEGIVGLAIGESDEWLATAGAEGGVRVWRFPSWLPFGGGEIPH